MKNLSENIKAVVHNGIFHADDVLCVALLRVAFPNATVEVVRTRNEAEFVGANFVLDVGNKNTVEGGTVFFDHHDRPDLKECHENGIQMAACGKLARHLGFPQQLWERALYAVEAQDNGQKELSLQWPNPFSFVSSLNVGWDKNLNGPEQRHQFDLVVAMSVIVLKNILAAIALEDKAEQVVSTAIGEATEHIAVLPQYVGGWQKFVCQHNADNPADRIMAVVFPSNSGYNVQMVPVSENSFDTYVSLPWKGLRGAELDTVSGIPGGVFVHSAGFLGAWESLESAVDAALKTVGTYEW